MDVPFHLQQKINQAVQFQQGFQRQSSHAAKDGTGEMGRVTSDPALDSPRSAA
jgi:hypothetical protein